MMCVFCGNKKKCWQDKTDEELELEWVKCDYDDYVLDDSIDFDELLGEADRRRENMKENE